MEPSQCIKIGIAFVCSSQCLKIWNDSFSAMCDNFRHNFRHCEIFSKKDPKFFGSPPPARINITPADNQYACGYFITRADIDMT